MISIIVAQAEDGVIGRNNELPWYLPNDLKRFKELTTGHTVIMGRNTFESIVKRIGKPLPERLNVVISSQLEPPEDGSSTVVESLDAALDAAAPDDDEVFIIGGARVYEEALEIADRIYLTQVEADIPGNVHFPELDSSQWRTIGFEQKHADERHPYAYQWIILERVA